MSRIVGVFLLISASATVGCIAAADLKKRVTVLQCVRRLVETLRIMIRYEALEVTDIACRIARDESLKDLGFTCSLMEKIQDMNCCSDNAVTFSDCWISSLDNCPDCLVTEDRALLARIGSTLGSCDCEGQLSALSLFSAEADRLAADALERYKAKGRLYRSLGAVAGALIAIIII